MAKAKWTKTNYPSIYKYAVKNGHKYGIRIRYQDNNLNWKEKSESGFLTIKAARKRKSELEETINKDLTTTFDGDKITFKKWFDQYFELNKLSWSKNTIQTVKSFHKNYLSHFDNMFLSKITLANYQVFINSKIESGLSVSTVKEIHRRMMAVINAAVKHELLNRNRLKDVVIKTDFKVVSKFKSIDKEALDKIDNVVFNEFPPLDVAMYILLRIGWRRSEIMGLKLGGISVVSSEFVEVSVETIKTDFEAAGTPKNPSSYRTNFLTGKYAELFVTALKKSEYLYTKNNKVFDEMSDFFVSGSGKSRGAAYVAYLTKRLSKKLDMHLTPHMFRHTFATQTLANGMNIVEVSKWLGHSKVKTTLNIYSHTSSESRNELVKFVNS